MVWARNGVYRSILSAPSPAGRSSGSIGRGRLHISPASGFTGGPITTSKTGKQVGLAKNVWSHKRPKNGTPDCDWGHKMYDMGQDQLWFCYSEFSQALHPEARS